MERLTYFECGKWRLKIGDTEYSGEAVDRLAAYEDTGLEPDEIDELKLIRWWSRCEVDEKPTVFRLSVDRLRELAQADREGRCLVLPCRVGNTVWTKEMDMENGVHVTRST